MHSCHSFKEKVLLHPASVQKLSFHVQLFMPVGTAQSKERKKSAEGSKHIDNAVHQTILHFLYAPFISDKKAAERFMLK